MITTQTPADWRSLQSEVASILSECGFAAEVEKQLLTPRGTVALDVYARELVRGRPYAIVCECKHWKASIPQTVIHAFRTVVAETGANIGYIISLNGFQSGSETAATHTNLKLVTWEEFQAAFEPSWLENYFSPVINERLDALVGFVEPLVQQWMCEVPKEDVEAIKKLRERYWALGSLVSLFAPYSAFLLSDKLKSRDARFPDLPLRNGAKSLGGGLDVLQSAILDARGYRELLTAMLQVGEQGIAEFNVIKTRNRK